MKEYRLKKWYPSLYSDITEGTEVEYKDGWIYYINTRGNKTTMEFDPYEFKSTDFWELIEREEPLFVTDDGENILDEYDHCWVVSKKKFYKRYMRAFIYDNGTEEVKNEFKTFLHEKNADRYIFENRRLFSYKDIVNWYFKEKEDLSTLETEAIKRNKNENSSD